MAPMSFTSLVSFLALSGLTLASPINNGAEMNSGMSRRDDIPTLGHSDIEIMPEMIGNGGTGKIYKKFQPYVRILSGCVPFPAVDADGNISGGLKPTGKVNGKCKHSDGQVYVRGKEVHGQFAVMYAYYFPKDQNTLKAIEDGLGHRHDWEAVVVWLEGNKKDAKVTGVSYSDHGDYIKIPADKNDFVGNHVKAAYSNFFVTHSMDTGARWGHVDYFHPMVSWDDMPEKARDALNEYNFGDAIVPMKDSDDRFDGQIEKAWSSEFE